MKASRTETRPDSNTEILKQLGLLPSTSHIQTTKGSSHVSEAMEQVDNARIETEKEKETEERKEDNGNVDDSAFLPTERPVQKNKKKCWICKTKLELAQRELGGCKCGEYNSKECMLNFSDIRFMHVVVCDQVCTITFDRSSYTIIMHC